jgi:hypothetical protein
MWSTKNVTSRKVNNIRQIQYHLKSVHDNLIDIGAENVFANEEYPWRVMPQMYEDHLKLILYRLRLLSHCADVEGAQDYVQTIRQNLQYLDKVLDAIWDEGSAAVEANIMNPDWRSEVLDMWLSIEGRVGRHDPLSVSTFIRNNDVEDLKSDPFEIGTPYDFYAFQ